MVPDPEQLEGTALAGTALEGRRGGGGCEASQTRLRRCDPVGGDGGEVGHERFEAVGRKIFAGLFGSSLFRVGKPVNS